MRKPDLRSRRLGPVRIHRADLDYVSALTSPSGKVEFRHDGFIYDTLDELAQHLNGRPARSIVVQPVADDGAAAVSISSHQVEVFALSDNADPANQIVTYLTSRVHEMPPLWWRVLYGSVGWLVAILMGALVLAFSDVPMLARSLAGGFVTIATASLLTRMQRPLEESAVFLSIRQAPNADRRPLIFFVAALSGLIGLALGAALG